MSFREVRSLSHLRHSASTTRALNLLSVWEKHGKDGLTAGYGARPFFTNPVLNRAIILKHRLRQDELDAFGHGRGDATKVILPIDPTNLRAGGRSFFVNQRGYESLLTEIGTSRPDADRRDQALLDVLDELPSLDPFLMRERLKRDGFEPDRCYFDLSEADHRRIFDFLRRELDPLITLTFADVEARLGEKSSKLAAKVLTNAGVSDLEPLRLGLGMGVDEFSEGMFSWMGFIYYKWTLNDLLPRIKPVADQIEAVRPFGPSSLEEREYVYRIRSMLSQGIIRACETVRRTLAIYDDAYDSLTRRGEPQAFRNFLLRAPRLFFDLGQRLGAVHHIISFWTFRFPNGARSRIGVHELMDLLADFENSLMVAD
ncbi:hypothetical protein [Phenylobacterium sp.]|uniref:hypothetical protein n=1 Tax=Phenylobacterium sp. TaxID=1871053 RepID=UPI0035B4F2ED